MATMEEHAVTTNNDEEISCQELPADVVLEVCLRLPIRKSYQCMSVCKSWRSIISNPDFSKAYESRNPPSLIVIRGVNRQESCWEFHYAPLRAQKVEQFIESPLKIRFYTKMTGMINGLVCSWYHHSLELCNLRTGTSICLPQPNMNCGFADQFKYMFSLNYYFGFDPLNKLYKLVKLTNDDCEILTLGNRDGWRRLPSPPHDDPDLFVERNNNILVNGILFIDCWNTLASFDFSKEEFRYIQFPDMGRPNFHLAQFKERLALIYIIDQSSMILCTLNDTEGYSWTSYEIFLPIELSSRPIVYAGNLPTGEILFTNKSQDSSTTLLYSYDCEINKFERFHVGKMPSSMILGLHFLAPAVVEQNFVPCMP